MFRFFALLAIAAVAFADIQDGLTSDFQTWLRNNGYSDWVDQFVRSDLGTKGSFGGKVNANDQITHQPVIFIHGNSDMALNPGTGNQYQTGWTMSTNSFLSNGYTNAELYGTTWGPANSNMAQQQTHSCDYLTKLRKFVEAVIAYTGADKVDIIGHSMGVTLGRKVIKGGTVPGGDCNLGAPLTAKVDTFLGIAGANRGLTTCEYSPTIPTCNKNNGFYPGKCPQFYCVHNSDIKGLSAYMVDLAQGPKYEGSYVYTFWSHADELIGFGDIVWGEPTSEIEWQDGEKTSFTNSHMQMKDLTGDWQRNAVINHSVA